MSSINLFLNQYDANVKRDYEKKLFDEYNEKRKDFHAENLSYRIIYEFQNEIRHSKIPKAKRKSYLEPLEVKFYIQKDYLNINRLKKKMRNFRSLVSWLTFMNIWKTWIWTCKNNIKIWIEYSYRILWFFKEVGWRNRYWRVPLCYELQGI